VPPLCAFRFSLNSAPRKIGHGENTEIERPVKSPPGCHDHRGIEYVEGFI